MDTFIGVVSSMMRQEGEQITHKVLAPKIQNQEDVFFETAYPDLVRVMVEEKMGQGLRLPEELDAFSVDTEVRGGPRAERFEYDLLVQFVDLRRPLLGSGDAYACDAELLLHADFHGCLPEDSKELLDAGVKPPAEGCAV